MKVRYSQVENIFLLLGVTAIIPASSELSTTDYGYTIRVILKLNKYLSTVIVAKYCNFLVEEPISSPQSGGDLHPSVDGCGGGGFVAYLSER
jgi:hypothetical protein